MKDSEKVLKLDDMITAMEIAHERAFVMATMIDLGYFDLTEDDLKLYSFSDTSVKFDILYDYMVQSRNLLHEARKTLRAWNTGKAGDCQ